jgi:hypothetical protein
LTGENKVDLAAILEALLGDAGRNELTGQRTARLKAMTRREKGALAEAMESLDALTSAIDVRARAIDSGAIQPLPPEAPPEPPQPEPVVASSPAPEPAIVSAKPAPEPAAAKPESGGQRRFNSTEELIAAFTEEQGGTGVSEESVPSVSDEDLAATRIDMEPVTPQVVRPTPKSKSTIRREPVSSTRADNKATVQDQDSLATRLETPAVKKPMSATKPAAFHEAPTIVVGAVDDAALLERAAALGLPTPPTLTVTERDTGETTQVSPPPARSAAPPTPAAAAPKPKAKPEPPPTPEPIQEEEFGIDAFEETAAGDTGHLAALEELNAPPEPTPIIQEEATPGWTRPAELLFDDALRLFRLGDSDGALISLERLLATMELNDDLREFIRVNEDRLLDLYHAIIGPWDKVPIPRRENDEPMPACFLATPKIAIVLKQIDGRNSMADIMQANSMTKLETVAVLSQLLRAKTITTDA